MKPRIKRSLLQRDIWWCSGDGYCGSGASPKAAYTDWLQGFMQSSDDLAAVYRDAQRKSGFFDRWFG